MRTYTYVADAIGAAFLAFTRGKEHYYNIANLSNLISIRDLAELIAKLDIRKKSKVVFATDYESNLKYLPFKLGIMDVTRIMELGWIPQVGLEEAFQYTFDSFLRRS